MFLKVGQGQYEAGIYDYNLLPFSGASVVENKTSVASYSFDSGKKELISYDTPAIAAAKAAYIVKNGLKGGMYWEVSLPVPSNWSYAHDNKLSGDKTGDDSIVESVGTVFGTLDQTSNHISFPG